MILNKIFKKMDRKVNEKVKDLDSTSFNFHYLKNKSSLPAFEVEILLSFLSGLSREKLLTYPEKDLGQEIFKKFRLLEKKRLKNWPIAYLIKEKSFFNSNFIVSKDVLVPRPETETLVQEVLEEINTSYKNNFNLIDLGTGSGAIIISLAKELALNNEPAFNQANFFGLDISSSALKIAKKNSSKISSEANFENKIIFKKSNLLSVFKKKLSTSNRASLLNDSSLASSDLIICANLPYLKPEELKEKSISREPKLALIAGKDGLKYYEKLFKELGKIINNKKLFLICEINPGQVEGIKFLAKKYLSDKKYKIKKDLAQKDRFFIVYDN